VRAIVQIEDLAPGGEGVGHAEGRAVFVPFTAPGDRVVVELPPGDGAVHAEALELLSEGPVRQLPPCPHFGPTGDRCGGCEWLHAAPLAQLAAKGRTLREALRKIGRLEPGTYAWGGVLASPAPLRYRSRAKLHLDRGAGRLVFFRRRSHEPVPLVECHLLVPGLEGLRAALGPAILAAGLSPREVSLEWSDLQGRGAALLALPAAGERERRKAEALLAAVPTLAGVVLQAEGGPPHLVGDPVLTHQRIPGDAAAGRCRSRPDVFQQANRGANALLVRAALELLRPDGEDALELFCGAGNFTGPLAARARSVAAVEQQGPALELARADLGEGQARAVDPARPAGSVRFFAGDALQVARAFARERGPSARRFGVALLDPPRDGAKGIGAVLRDLGVARAVYVSCDPATLARDLKGCVDAGFRVDSVQGIDLFPQTHHVEGLALVTDPGSAAKRPG
jgi:23S rRNA (uracil1939-C5)-methyltransferase